MEATSPRAALVATRGQRTQRCLHSLLVAASWFEPETGLATLVGEFTGSDYAPNGGFARTTPASGEDWVLVIDDIAAGLPAPAASHLWTPGDTSADDSVNVDDLIAVILAWGPCPPAFAPCLADIAVNGDVDVDDLIAVILGWGE